MMKKKLAVISTACLLILASDPIPSYATPDSPDSSSDVLDQSTDVDTTEDVKAIFDSLYQEGYSLGEEDGYAQKKFEQFDQTTGLDKSSEEFTWFMMGYTVGYKKGQQQKEEELKTEQENEMAAGEEEGYQQGVLDYKHATVQSEIDPFPSKSSDWNKGYVQGYKKAISLMDLSVKAKKEGYDQGLENDSMSVPSMYDDEDVTRQAFTEGFETAQAEVLKHQKKQFEKQGYVQGYHDLPLEVPAEAEGELQTAFEQGYEKGQKQKQKDVKADGYDSAFTYQTYRAPKSLQDKPELEKWYKAGFYSNKDVKSLQQKAYKDGWKLGKEVSVPRKYKQNKAAVAMYKKYFEQGQKKQDKTVSHILLGSGIVLTLVALITLWRLRRRKNEDTTLDS
ncbi:hypothetical protein COJ01_25330 [Priestia megaterium]|uniref:hypothetical protein n=2 Tax=Priestia megaterium TaxID=1404 RepID=UPI000BF7DDEB|nr:hypothetical protein COJ01_25330 [Priestia megaterium]RCX27618.1 hypothetical protein DEU47_1021019 [Bacillus sp. AG236]